MLEEHVKLRGRVRVQEWPAEKYPTYESILKARGRGDKPLREYAVNNLIVTAGKNHIADVLIAAGGVQADVQYCGVGSGSTPPAAGDTDLETPVGSREAYSDRFRTNNIATFSFFYGANDNNGTWNECGLFWLTTGGDMLARALFSPAVNKTASVTEVVEWDITVG